MRPGLLLEPSPGLLVFYCLLLLLPKVLECSLQAVQPQIHMILLISSTACCISHIPDTLGGVVMRLHGDEGEQERTGCVPQPVEIFDPASLERLAKREFIDYKTSLTTC
jgi:hypothetical protein